MITAQAASGFLTSLFEAHPAIGKCKVTIAFSGRTLYQVDTSARSTVGEIRFRNLYIAGNLVVVAEILRFRRNIVGGVNGMLRGWGVVGLLLNELPG